MKVLIIILFSIFFEHSYAFKYSPMSITLKPNENKNSDTVYIENDSTAPVAIQVSTAKRIMDKLGKEDNSEETESFEIFPSQMIVGPYEKRAVKVNWIGKKIEKKELAFRLIAEQLPLNVDKTENSKNNVKILLRYIGALYVDPGSTQSEVELKKMDIEKDKIKFILHNKGNKHQVLSNLNIKFSKKSEKDIILNSKILPDFSGENLLPEMEREFSITKSKEISKVDTSYKVEFNFDKD